MLHKNRISIREVERLSSQMIDIKSQAGNKTQHHSESDLRYPYHPAFDRFQADRAVLCQDRAVRFAIKPDAEAAFGFCDQGFSFMPAHSREIVDIEITLRAKPDSLVFE